MDFSLAVTDKLLHFGLEHPTSLSFAKPPSARATASSTRTLFARVFDKAAAQGQARRPRAYVVHSAKAEVLGRKLPFRGFEDHDWVLIQEGTGEDARRWFVDPTMHDAGLGWDISANVRGAVKLPQ